MSHEVVLGVTGSIAAYKAAEIVRQMRKRTWNVTVVMTASACEFVGPLTFRTLSQRPVVTTMFPQPPPPEVPHIAMADRAELLVIAPCTANVIAKLAHGIADDVLTCTALACRAPVLLAPAMNVNMWEHVATRTNLDVLAARGVEWVDVTEGDLACGYEGKGRMADPGDIVARAAVRLGEVA